MWASGPLSCSVAADALFQIQPLLPATDTVHFCLQISNATNSQCLLSGHIGGQNGSSHIRSLALQSWPFARTDFKFTTSAGSAHSWLQQQLLRHQQEDESLASVSLAALFPALVLLLIVAFVLGSLVRLHAITRTVETGRNNEKVAGLKVCVIGGKGSATVAPPPLLNNQRCLK
ncbi:hypothetical protein HDE_10754 [Halotydeus destructor]|nr:hypothetical protein HDE_10754 [Halotydeus destructor]